MTDAEFKAKHGLTARQLAFVVEFLKHFNATKAAKNAGYSEKTAKQMGSENLSKPAIQAALVDLVGNSIEDAGVSTAYLLDRLKREADGNFKEKKGYDTSSAARSTALSHLAKIAGAFTEDRPNPNAGLSEGQLIDRVEGMFKTFDKDVLKRLRKSIDAALK